MKRLLTVTVLGTALVCLVSSTFSAEAAKNAIPRDVKPVAQVGLYEYLSSEGNLLHCYFTLEGDAVTGDTLAYRLVEDRKVQSVAELGADLKKQVPNVVLTTDEHNPHILHIRDKSLINKANYVMDEKISAKYSGLLVGLPIFLGNQTGDRITSLQPSSVPVFFDYTTSVQVDAKNKPIRDILSQGISLPSYVYVLWESWIQKNGDQEQVQVHYFGSKASGDALLKSIMSRHSTAK